MRSAKLVDVQKEHIRGVLEAARWRIRGAVAPRINSVWRPTTLETRMHKSRTDSAQGELVTVECSAAELELQGAFRLPARVFAAARNRGAGHTADGCTDSGAFAAARNTPTMAPRPAPPPTLRAVRLPSPLPWPPRSRSRPRILSRQT